jgi:TPR repeat protein
MDKLILGILIIWAVFWLLGVVLRVISDIADSVSQGWERTKPNRQRVGYAVGYPTGVLAAAIADHRLMSSGLAITVLLAAVLIGSLESAFLVSAVDALGGQNFPILGWAVLGGAIGIAMGVGSKVIELGWFSHTDTSRVPDINSLRSGEDAAKRHFKAHLILALVGSAVLLFALVYSFFMNSGYDARSSIETKKEIIATAGANGNIPVLNSALEDSASLVLSDPKSGLRILLAIEQLSKEGGRIEIERIAKIAQIYLANYRKETEKSVVDGKPKAMEQSEAFSVVDRVQSLKWLSHLHELGKGGADRDLFKAYSYLSEAAKAGDKTALAMQEKLVASMISSKQDSDRIAAFKYLEPRAQSGRPFDLYWLGEWYARSGKPEDLKAAERWLGKALTQKTDETVKKLAFSSLSKLKDLGMDSTQALDALAPIYAKSKGSQIKNEAYAYLEKRANAGDPGAALWMGFRHAEGDGISKDAKKAREWFLQAARQDKNTAIKDLALNALGERVTPKRAQNGTAPPLRETPSTTPPSMGNVAPNIAPNAASATMRKEPPFFERELSRPASPEAVENKIDSTSKKVQIPANSSPSYNAAQGWTCNFGYKQAGNECQYISKPTNSAHSYNAVQGWTCNFGYKQVGNECQYISKPTNSAHSYNAAQGWTCNFGYKQVGEECWKIEASR